MASAENNKIIGIQRLHLDAAYEDVMESHKIEPHRITRPIQLMAVWFVVLLLTVTLFLTAAVKIHEPKWLCPALVIFFFLYKQVTVDTMSK